MKKHNKDNIKNNINKEFKNYKRIEKQENVWRTILIGVVLYFFIFFILLLILGFISTNFPNSKFPEILSMIIIISSPMYILYNAILITQPSNNQFSYHTEKVYLEDNDNFKYKGKKFIVKNASEIENLWTLGAFVQNIKNLELPNEKEIKVFFIEFDIENNKIKML